MGLVVQVIMDFFEAFPRLQGQPRLVDLRRFCEEVTKNRDLFWNVWLDLEALKSEIGSLKEDPVTLCTKLEKNPGSSNQIVVALVLLEGFFSIPLKNHDLGNHQWATSDHVRKVETVFGLHYLEKLPLQSVPEPGRGTLDPCLWVRDFGSEARAMEDVFWIRLNLPVFWMFFWISRTSANIFLQKLFCNR